MMLLSKFLILLHSNNVLYKLQTQSCYQWTVYMLQMAQVDFQTALLFHTSLRSPQLSIKGW